ncbi:MAG TPA: CoA transferase [Stellaceae bacterium]|nr:CoA transferase [Stellaceae bacterium]
MTALPLSRFKVIDLTRARAGPTCARILGDWGADVIKVEAKPGAGGDDLSGARHNYDFQNLHRNKRSLTLDLKQEDGRQVLYRLAETADVVVENYRPDVKRRLQIDYETLRAINPRLVYGSISGFGQTGPYRDRPGVDQIAQGMGGLMSITGLPGQGPVRVGIPIADLTSGMFLAIGILMALLDRERTGEGRWVQTSLLEAQIAMLDFQATRWLIKEEVAGQAGNNHPKNIPMGLFRAKDGHINIAGSSNELYGRMCRALEAPALLENPRYRTEDSRAQHRDELNAVIEEYLSRRTCAEWIEIMNRAGVPCGPVNRIDQVFADPQVQHLGIAQPVAHPKLGEIRLVGEPVAFDGTRPEIRSATPELGEHTEEVLRGLGYDEAAIRDLRGRNVV